MVRGWFLEIFSSYFSAYIVIINVYLIFGPFNQNNIEDQIEDYLYKAIISFIEFNRDLRELGLLIHTSTLGIANIIV